jgi:hypothetical protein
MPRSNWIPLRDALWCAFQGDAPAGSAELDTEDNYRPQPGSLLHGLTSDKARAKRKEFDKALSQAALDGDVHFEGCRLPNTPPEPIPRAYFVKPRGFSTDGSITPWAYNPLVYLRPMSEENDGVTWKEVVVNRNEFSKWLAREFPEFAGRICGSQSDENEPDQTGGSAMLAQSYEETGGASPIYSTGAPGRPSSKHLVKPELRRRAENGLLLSTLTEEAGHLSRWLEETHPGAPPMTQKTIENSLRALYHSLKKTRSQQNPKMK